MAASHKNTDFLRRPIDVTRSDAGKQKNGLRASLTMKLQTQVQLQKSSPETCDDIAGFLEVKRRPRLFDPSPSVKLSLGGKDPCLESPNLAADRSQNESDAKVLQDAVNNGHSTTRDTSKRPVSQRLTKTASQTSKSGHLSFKSKRLASMFEMNETVRKSKKNEPMGCKLYPRADKLSRIARPSHLESLDRQINASASISKNVYAGVANTGNAEGKAKRLADSPQLTHSPPDCPTLKKLFTYPSDQKWKTNTAGNTKFFEPLVKSRFAPGTRKTGILSKYNKQADVSSALLPLKSKVHKSFRDSRVEALAQLSEPVAEPQSESISGSGSKVTEFLNNLQAYQNYYLRDLLDALETNSSDLVSQHFRKHFRSSLNYLKLHARSKPACCEIAVASPSPATENTAIDINKTAPANKPKENIFLSQTKTEYGFSLKSQAYSFPSDMIILSEDELVEEEEQVTNNEALSVSKTNKQSKLLVLFDLDETLIRSNIEGGFIGTKEADFTIRLESKNNLEFGVIVRPHLAEVLEILSAHCEVGVFTASREGYAKPIIDRIDPKGLITKRFYRQHCSLEKGFGFTKLLRGIEEEIDFNRVIIVDNLVGSFANELYNGIPILPFYGDRSDDQLAKLLPFLLHLAGVRDVKAAISLHFTWHDWLAKMG